MQHVLTLRKIFLVLGFALVTFGCDTAKDQLSNANKEVLATENFYDASGTLTDRYVSEYDSNGNWTKASFYDKDGVLTRYWVLAYKPL